MTPEQLTEQTIKAFVSEFIQSSKNIFSTISDETKQLYQREITRYLEKQHAKFITIKTILKGSTPVPFYSVYYPLHLENHRHKASTTSISNVFEKSQLITIIGDAGSGKSTLAKHLFLRALSEKTLIPIFIELRYLDKENNDIENFIKNIIFQHNLSQNENILERLLQSGKFLFFLDGYDEIPSDVLKKAVQGIRLFIDKYTKNHFILTTRPYSNIDLLDQFHNYHISELDKNDIQKFVEQQLVDEPELATEINTSVADNTYESYINSFLKNPLLLSLYILTFQSDPTIPSQRFIFYRRVVNALFSEHDSRSKLGFTREKKSSLQQEQFERILKAFCFLSYFEAKYDFDYDYIQEQLTTIKSKHSNIEFNIDDFLHDMKVAVSLWVEDGGIFSFAHRSLQEYFAARFIKELPGEQNTIAYNKLKNLISKSGNGNQKSRRSVGEIDNFLGLCEEMDEFHYLKNFAQPMCQDLFNKIDPTNIPLSMFNYLCKGIRFRGRKTQQDQVIIDIILIVNEEVYATIPYHYAYTSMLHNNVSFLLGLMKYNPKTKKLTRRHSRQPTYEKSNEVSEIEDFIEIPSNIIKNILSLILKSLEEKKPQNRASMSNSYFFEEFPELHKNITEGLNKSKLCDLQAEKFYTSLNLRIKSMQRILAEEISANNDFLDML